MEVSRRSFLKRGLLLGSGTMLSGVAGTAMTAPTKKIPYKLRVFGFYGGKELINHPSPNS